MSKSIGRYKVGDKLGASLIVKMDKDRISYVCECGVEKSVRRDFACRIPKSCNCSKSSKLKKGDVYGRLTLIKADDNPAIKKWECICDCGKSVSVSSNSLISGTSKSCGCSKHSKNVIKSFDIINEYKNGAGVIFLARKYKSSNRTISKILEKNGVTKRSLNKVFDSSTENLVVNSYVSGESIKNIGERMLIEAKQVSKILDKLGTPKRSNSECRREYLINEDTFYNLTNDAMYWLGMLGSDGNVCKNNVTLGLKVSDIDHVENFLSFCGSNKQPYIYAGSAYATLASKRMVDSLLRFNIYPNKSLTYRPTEYLAKSPHFWRGMIDGDGCISLSKTLKPTISLCGGSYECIKMFETWVKSKCDTKASVKKHKNRNLYTFSVSHNYAIKIINELYGIQHKYRLERKFEKAKMFLTQNSCNGIIN